MFLQESLESCHQTVVAKGFPVTWYTSYEADSELRCFQVVRQTSFHQTNGCSTIVADQCLVLKDLPPRVSSEVVSNLIDTISVSNICSRNYEERFIALVSAGKGKFLSMSGEIVALLDESFCVQLNGVQYSSIVRHHDCHLLTEGLNCTPCYKFRDTHHSLFCKSNQLFLITPSLYTNFQWLKTPQKNACLMSLRKAIKTKNRQLKQLNVIVEKDGVQVDEHL